MHAKSDLRVVLKWMTAGSGSVITDVIRLLLLLNLAEHKHDCRSVCEYCGIAFDVARDACRIPQVAKSWQMGNPDNTYSLPQLQDANTEHSGAL